MRQESSLNEPLIRPTRQSSRTSLHSVWLWFLVFSMAAGGCASTGPGVGLDASLPDRFPNHTADDILDRLPAYPAAMSRLFAESRIALSSPEERGRFSAKISYLHPESLFVRVTFPLGIEGARVLVTPDTAWVYDRIEKVVWTGSPDRVAAVLPGAVAGLRLVEMATGFERIDPDIAWNVRTDSTLYILTSPDETTRYTVDPARWRIVAVRLQDEAGSTLEQRWYSDFAQVGEVVVPRRMALSRPPEDLRISMALQRLELSPSMLTFRLDTASDAQWIDLGQ